MFLRGGVQGWCFQKKAGFPDLPNLPNNQNNQNTKATTVRQSNIAMENGPIEDVFPIILWDTKIEDITL